MKASHDYKYNLEEISDKQIFLTNAHINLGKEGYDEDSSLEELKKEIINDGGNWDYVWNQFKDICIKTILTTYDDEYNNNLLALSTRDNNCFSPTLMKTNSNIKKDCLCICENVCNCPCHCISCVCCPCVKERQDPDTSEYYRNLYLEIKSELELEKKRNERMKYNKKINENNMENVKKEKEILLNEIEQLKDKLGETMDKLKEETEKNIARDNELYIFKEEEIPKLKESYEKMIKKIKDDSNKQING